jgi:archaellum component FlaC
MADYVEQRVTNAVIMHTLESLRAEQRKGFDDLDKRMSATEEKLDQVRISAAPCGKRFEGIEGKVDGLEKKINGWSSINSVGALFAMILGIFSK